MKTVALPCGERVPCFGMGTWNIGEQRALRQEELAALRLGLDLGLRLIDTAEMYGDGRSETLVAQAIAGRRDDVFLVTKVYPHNASRDGLPLACERSLRRLKTDRIDLYLLHWPGSIPLAETVEAFESLVERGRIRHWGVSNFDLEDMKKLAAVPGGTNCQANQVLYNLVRRQPEWALAPWMRRQRMALMAYSPIEQARLLDKPALRAFARKHGVTAPQAALAWLLSRDGALPIPKAGSRRHLEENAKALDLQLTPEQAADLDAAFPPPAGPAAIEML